MEGACWFATETQISVKEEPPPLSGYLLISFVKFTISGIFFYIVNMIIVHCTLWCDRNAIQIVHMSNVHAIALTHCTHCTQCKPKCSHCWWLTCTFSPNCICVTPLVGALTCTKLQSTQNTNNTYNTNTKYRITKYNCVTPLVRTDLHNWCISCLATTLLSSWRVHCPFNQQCNCNG